MWHAWWKCNGTQWKTWASRVGSTLMIAKTEGLHVSDIKGDPVEVESLDVVDCVFQEGMPRGDGHERVVKANRKPWWGDPVDGEEEVHRLEALYIEIEVYAAHFVENKVSDYVRTLDLYSEAE